MSLRAVPDLRLVAVADEGEQHVRAVDERVDAFTGWRIALAKEALHRDGSTLASVAREVGYASEFALSAAFRRTVGEPPGRWRQRTRPA